jgi:hypothetical protein
MKLWASYMCQASESEGGGMVEMHPVASFNNENFSTFIGVRKLVHEDTRAQRRRVALGG